MTTKEARGQTELDAPLGGRPAQDVGCGPVKRRRDFQVQARELQQQRLVADAVIGQRKVGRWEGERRRHACAARFYRAQLRRQCFADARRVLRVRRDLRDEQRFPDEIRRAIRCGELGELAERGRCFGELAEMLLQLSQLLEHAEVRGIGLQRLTVKRDRFIVASSELQDRAEIVEASSCPSSQSATPKSCRQLASMRFASATSSPFAIDLRQSSAAAAKLRARASACASMSSRFMWRSDDSDV